MNQNPEIEAGIRRHLQKVDEALDGPREERAEILDNVESHVRAALAARGGAVTLRDLEAVLAEMDPPASYGDGARRPPALRRSRFQGCLLILGSAVLLFILAVVVYCRATYAPPATGGQDPIGSRKGDR